MIIHWKSFFIAAFLAPFLIWNCNFSLFLFFTIRDTVWHWIERGSQPENNFSGFVSFVPVTFRRFYFRLNSVFLFLMPVVFVFVFVFILWLPVWQCHTDLVIIKIISFQHRFIKLFPQNNNKILFPNLAHSPVRLALFDIFVLFEHDKFFPNIRHYFYFQL